MSSNFSQDFIFQFTPLREGRPRKGEHGIVVCRISIHAPPRGATAGCITVVAIKSNFNSRPSARGDLNPASSMSAVRRISIHAPPRGATGVCCCHPVQAIYFNSRPSARGDRPNCEGQCSGIPNFNSRPSARGDHWRW